MTGEGYLLEYNNRCSCGQKDWKARHFYINAHSVKIFYNCIHCNAEGIFTCARNPMYLKHPSYLDQPTKR